MKAFVFFLVLQRASKSAPIDAGYSVVAPLSLPPYSMKYLNATQNEKKKNYNSNPSTKARKQ